MALVFEKELGILIVFLLFLTADGRCGCVSPTWIPYFNSNLVCGEILGTPSSKEGASELIKANCTPPAEQSWNQVPCFKGCTSKRNHTSGIREPDESHEQIHTAAPKADPTPAIHKNKVAVEDGSHEQTHTPAPKPTQAIHTKAVAVEDGSYN